MTNQTIINGIARFLVGETLAECPIVITSREQIEGEDAELVRFTFDEYKESCIAVVYADGTTYTPVDWQTPDWDADGWSIEGQDWMDCNGNRCITLNGLPRVLG